MSLATGTRVGPYEITGVLGAGGMGEVYRAHDARLGRDVALKVLPALFAADPDRLARFQREAQVLAALKHPNIGAIYGLEETTAADGSHLRALVLELVDGDTLADRIARGPVPVDEALPIAKLIAEALEAAHEQGVIHRDLKPSNIKITPDGHVKVLDFGLAKLTESAGSWQQAAGSAHLSLSPTITSPAATTLGVILGTAAYMSPEQAKGRPADKRSDVWAFGCVLYEMLTGRGAFHADDVSDTLALVLKGEADWKALPDDLPASIRTLIRACLEKDRRQRLADIAGALFVLGHQADLAPPVVAAAPSVPTPRALAWRRIAAVAGLALTTAALAAAGVWFATRPAPPRVTRTTITLPAAAAVSIDGNDRDLAVTPDGTRVIYASRSRLFVRPLDALEPTALATLNGGAQGLFTSPDGQWVGYVENNTTLKKVAITGGPPVTLLTMDTNSRGVTWAANDTVVFATSQPATGLLSVPAAGGSATVLTRPDAAHGEADHLWPEVLPGGRKVLFTITAVNRELDAAQVAVLDLDTGSHKTLLRGGSHAHYIASGHLVYAAAGTLRAVAFDLDRLEVRGTPVPVVPRLVTTAVGAADFGVTAGGTLVYIDAPGFSGIDERTLSWVDRKGVETPLSAPPRPYQYPRLSPDGTRVALFISDQEQDLWIWDLMRATLTRLTFESGIDDFPVWTPDGQRLVFSSQRAGPAGNLYLQAANGTGAVERLTESRTAQIPTGISPDGTRVVFYESPQGQGGGLPDLRLLTLPPAQDSGVAGSPSRGFGAAPPSAQRVGEAGRSVQTAGEPQRTANGEVVSLFETRFVERNGIISPDGRWLAYEANPSGQFEIYVRPFPNVGDGQWQVSTGGGRQPLWARSGRELFFLAPDGTLLSVTVDARGANWSAGSPMKLLEGESLYQLGSGFAVRMYDVSPDGQRFLMINQGTDQNTAPPQIVVIENWTEELKRLVPTN